MHPKKDGIFSFVLSVLLLSMTTGCSTETEAEKYRNSKDTEQKILGKWRANAKATKLGWGKDREELEIKFADMLELDLSFHANKTVSYSFPASANQTFWSVKSKDNDSITILAVLSESANGESEVKITFESIDRIVYQSSDTEGKDSIVFDRR